MPGCFITLEGGEGAGKTTQSRLLAEHLTARGLDILRTREPGGAEGAEALRRFLLERDHGLSLRAEAMLHFAARMDHVEKTIQPALQEGRHVLCDRFADSTVAYQGYGLGHGDPDLLSFIGRLASMVRVKPHLTLILDIPAAERRHRLQRRGGADRYEVLDEAFHQRVADGFRRIAQDEPARCRLVSAAGPVAAVQASLLEAIDPVIAG